MFDPSQIISRNMDAARRFYRATARPLGLSVLEASDDGFMVGRAGAGTMLRVRCAEAMSRADEGLGETQPAHVALEAPDDMTVRAFFRAALEAGGRQLGRPAPQPTGGQGSYYAARVIDPDGNCIECGWRH